MRLKKEKRQQKSIARRSLNYNFSLVPATGDWAKFLNSEDYSMITKKYCWHSDERKTQLTER